MSQPGWNRSGHPVEDSDAAADLRERMVTSQIAARGVRDVRVLEAMRLVPRHLFVPPDQLALAYEDIPLPIGHEQTISQPYIVALMTELARPQPADRVLEVGTGCGYQAAVLARLVAHVFSLEIVPALAQAARERLERLGIANVTVREADGYEGWPEEAPFDVILAAAAPEETPPALVAQLAPGGRLVLPVGPLFNQELVMMEKDRHGEGVRTRTTIPVRFVPLVRAPSRGHTER